MVIDQEVTMIETTTEGLLAIMVALIVEDTAQINPEVSTVTDPPR